LIAIDDPADPRVADFTGLTDAELRRREEPVFIIEGVIAIDRLLESNYGTRALLVLPKHASRFAATTAVPVYVASPEVMNAVVGFDIHRGALASARRPELPVIEELLRTARTVAVLEGLNDQENMGALFRNAAAFGIDAVVLSPDCCDPLYRRSVRVSMGHALHVPFTRLDDWAGAVERIRACGLATVALTPDPAAEDISTLDWSERVALFLGAEGPGLTDAIRRDADHRVRIPISADVDSLNVATAAAIAFHHRFG
jgi:tRNA G18 (ribose-2'-O)-methylase SpoU